MFNYAGLREADDYFKTYSNRETKGIYFYRLINYSPKTKKFLLQFLEESKVCGVYVKGKISNPDERQLSYFEEMIGLDFRLEKAFFDGILKKWLPRLDMHQRGCVVEAMYDTLEEMRNNGKNDNILKNAYIKFMCWFYYKFERILNQLGKDKIPKILYEGYPNDYELKMLSILAKTGCDILLVQSNGDDEYRKVDAASKYSKILPNAGTEKFPEGFSVLNLQREAETERALPKIQIEEPDKIVNTNTWLINGEFSDSLKPASERGTDERFYYNMFVRLLGMEDKAVYLNELLRWKLKLEANGRTVVIEEREIRVPDMDEVQKIARKNYPSPEQMIIDLSGSIKFPKSKELEKLAKKAFTEVMLELKEKDGTNLNRMCNKAVYMLCWINRYVPRLFPDWQVMKQPVFIYYGVCRNENETLFLKILSKLPADVMIICPDLNSHCLLEDKFLFEKKYEHSAPIDKFPTQIDNVRFGTVAYHAEQDLNTIIYQDTGIYRNRQFKKAIPVQLQTTYEEIRILWDQEANYRPNFEILDDRVMVPVIYSKISGVPNGNVEEYWNNVDKLVVEDTFVVPRLPFITSDAPNPMKQHAAAFLKNGKLQIQKIKAHPSYQYGFIREDMQDYMFDRMQQLIDKKTINGTFTNGAEFTIVSTLLNLNKEILRLIQKFDFTKKVPKLIMISTGEEICTLEDSIFTEYLSTLGFDIAIFTPTGYQSVERFFTNSMILEHQIGEYMYDLRVPNYRNGSRGAQKEGFMDKLFRRGRG